MPTLFFDYKVRSTARTPSYDGTETTSWADVSKTLSAWADALGWEGVGTVGDLSQDQRRKAAGHSLLGEVEAETWRELMFFPVVNPNTGALNRNALQAVIGGRGSQADIPAEALESAQSSAERLLDNEFSDESSHSMSQSEKDVDLKATAERVAGALDVATEIVMDAFNEIQERPDDGMGGPSGDGAAKSDAPFVTIEGETKREGGGGMPVIDPGYPTRMGGSVKQVDTSTRVVTGYYAAFGNVDADREEFAQGAFEDTIRRRGPMGSGRIKHLWQHDPRKPIGVPEELREDENGLYFETRIVDTRLGTDALKLYEEGVITEHSVGFNRIDQEPRDDGSTLITEVQLWEGSSVTWGANPNTPTTGIKGTAPNMETLAQKAQGMRKVLSRGLSEAVAAQVEIGLKQIEDALRRGEGAPPDKKKTIDVLGSLHRAPEQKSPPEQIVITP